MSNGLLADKERLLGRHQTTVSTNMPCRPKTPLCARLPANVCRNECKLGAALSEASVDALDDVLSDVQRFWNAVPAVLAPFETDDVLFELKFDVCAKLKMADAMLLDAMPLYCSTCCAPLNCGGVTTGAALAAAAASFDALAADVALVAAALASLTGVAAVSLPSACCAAANNCANVCDVFDALLVADELALVLVERDDGSTAAAALMAFAYAEDDVGAVSESGVTPSCRSVTASADESGLVLAVEEPVGSIAADFNALKAFFRCAWTGAIRPLAACDCVLPMFEIFTTGSPLGTVVFPMIPHRRSQKRGQGGG